MKTLTVLWLVAALSFSTIGASKKSHAAILMSPDIELGVGVMTVGAILWFTGDQPYVTTTQRIAVSGTVFLIGLALDESDLQPGINWKNVKDDLRHVEPKIAKIILKDLRILESVDSATKIKLLVPPLLGDYLSGDDELTLEELEAQECEYIVSTQKQLSDLATKVLTSKNPKLKKRYEVHFETARYLLEKWPNGFESDLSSSDISKRLQIKDCGAASAT